MNDVMCPRCRKTNRAAAHFCVSCGGSLAGAAPAAPASTMGQQVQQVAGQVAQAVAPVAGQVARQSWQASRKGMGWFARLITGGGRSAYTEIISPQPVMAGQIISPPIEDAVPGPLELSALFFVLGLLLSWLIFILPEWWQQLLAILGLTLILLSLNFASLRRPAFSSLTWARLLGRARQVPRLTCQVQDQATQKITRLTMIGRRSPGQIVQGTNLLVYGTYYPSQNEVRAWKLDLGGDQIITASRLTPLIASLLLAPLLLSLAWLLIWGIPFLLTLSE